MNTNSEQFVRQQYGNSSNLDIRIRIHEMYSTTEMDWHEWVFEQMDFAPDSRVIEFGCGSGDLWIKNAAKRMAKWNVTLTDNSAGMLAKAEQTIGNHPQFTYKLMDIQAVEYEDNTFDAAIANHMLYHVPNLDQALSELSRIVKPGGTLYASTIGLKHMNEIYEFAAEFDSSLSFTKPLNSKHFGLENGMEKLQTYFGQVELLRFESDLHITDVQHLADYMFTINSNLKEALLQKEAFHSFIEFLESKKTAEGYVRISKDSGLFVCTK